MKKKSEQIRTVGLIANYGKAGSRDIVRQAAELVKKSRRTVLSDEETASFAGLGCKVLPDVADVARRSDCLLVFGGDGTMLRALRECQGARTPILGINVGRLGFLTAVPSKNLRPALEQIWAKDFVIESRSLIEAFGHSRGKSINLCALNDIVISRAASRMIELEVSVNGETLTRYRSDGLIVSSPTGSTAYSLSAGGAIVSPDAAVFEITPICPHTLSNRSVIVGNHSVIAVKVISEHLETTLTADGQVEETLVAGDIITIRQSRRTLQLLSLSGSSFFNTLRQKLHWSGSNV